MYLKNVITLTAIAVAAVISPANAQPKTWTGLYQSEGRLFVTNMIGEAPSLGRTTHIPVVLVPLTLKIDLGVFTFDPSKRQPDAALSAVDAILQSPLFQSASFPNHPETKDHPTQYLDAYQRNNFWNFVTGGPGTTGVKADFHILLNDPVIIPRTLNVPLQFGSVEKDGDGFRGLVDWVFLTDQLGSLLEFSPSSALTLFVMDNVVITNAENKGPGHTAGGFHSHKDEWTYAFTTFNARGHDVTPTGHELAEWLVNPLGTSKAPGFISPGGDCAHGMEVGDQVRPLGDARFFQIDLNGHTFTMQDLVFESWFARGTPSMAKNGWVTFMGHDLPNTPCQ